MPDGEGQLGLRWHSRACTVHLGLSHSEAWSTWQLSWALEHPLQRAGVTRQTATATPTTRLHAKASRPTGWIEGSQPKLLQQVSITFLPEILWGKDPPKDGS